MLSLWYTSSSHLYLLLYCYQNHDQSNHGTSVNSTNRSTREPAFTSTIHTTNTPSQTPQCALLLNHLHTLTTIIPRLLCLKPAKLHLSVNENHPLSLVSPPTQTRQVPTTEYPLLLLRPAPGQSRPRQTTTGPLYLLLLLSWYLQYLLR